MEPVPLKSWKVEFARIADNERYRESLRRAKDDGVKKDKDKDRKEREDRADDLLDMAIMASAEDIEDFTVTLDLYDTASCAALLANEEKLVEAVRVRDDVLGKAYKLPDGTIVFESEDGKRVLTADGQELDASVITPEAIEDWRPRFETFDAAKGNVDALQSERTELLAYQAQLDAAREQVKDGDISQDDLTGLKAQLAEEMPDSVRAQLAPENRPALDDNLGKDVAPAAASAIQPGGQLQRLKFD